MFFFAIGATQIYDDDDDDDDDDTFDKQGGNAISKARLFAPLVH